MAICIRGERGPAALCLCCRLYSECEEDRVIKFMWVLVCVSVFLLHRNCVCVLVCLWKWEVNGIVCIDSEDVVSVIFVKLYIAFPIKYSRRFSFDGWFLIISKLLRDVALNIVVVIGMWGWGFLVRAMSHWGIILIHLTIVRTWVLWTNPLCSVALFFIIFYTWNPWFSLNIISTQSFTFGVARHANYGWVGSSRARILCSGGWRSRKRCGDLGGASSTNNEKQRKFGKRK